MIANLEAVAGVTDIMRTIEKLTDLEQKDRIQTQNQFLEEISSLTARVLSFLFLASVVAAAAVAESEDKNPLEGVDPNTLSCDPAGQIFLLLPHFTNCSKFFMCVHGQEVEFDCPASLIFDFLLQTCNWATAVECVLRDEEGSGFSDDDLLGNEVGNNAAAEAIDRAHLYNQVLNCDRPESAAKQVAYRGDCQRYWKCINGVPQSAYCSDGLFFNESTMQCDHEANVKCLVQIEDELKGEFMVYQ